MMGEAAARRSRRSPCLMRLTGSAREGRATSLGRTEAAQAAGCTLLLHSWHADELDAVAGADVFSHWRHQDLRVDP